MKAAQIKKYGGREVVEINENVSKPVPGAGELLVEVYAAGLNPFDWKIREGYVQQMVPLQLPATLGIDFSGMVAEIGEQVSGFQLGDEIFGQASIMKAGSFAEFVLASPTVVARKPNGISHAVAAALPIAGVSALQGLMEHMKLSSGQKILIHGGAGGIGTFAIQLAKHLGAHVATTAAGDEISYVKELGADEVIDYKIQTFEDILRDYDAVFDTVGGDVYKRSFKMLKKGGIIVSMLEQPNAELMSQYGVTAIAQGTQVNRERLAKLADLVAQGAIRVHIDKVFSLEQAGEALAYLQQGHPRGKVVLEVKK